jgi:hypothetical protein
MYVLYMFKIALPPLPAANPLNVSDEVKAMILDCLKQNSSEPATVRCAYPNPPSLLDQFMAFVGSVGESTGLLNRSISTSRVVSGIK